MTPCARETLDPWGICHLHRHHEKVRLDTRFSLDGSPNAQKRETIEVQRKFAIVVASSILSARTIQATRSARRRLEGLHALVRDCVVKFYIKSSVKFDGHCR